MKESSWKCNGMDESLEHVGVEKSPVLGM